MAQRYLIVGVIALLLGVQLRMVDTFVLTQRASQFVEKNVRNSGFQSEDPYDSLLLTAGPVPKKSVQPPRWLGWAAISVGAVLVLHGLSIRRQ